MIESMMYFFGIMAGFFGVVWFISPYKPEDKVHNRSQIFCFWLATLLLFITFILRGLL